MSTEITAEQFTVIHREAVAKAVQASQDYYINNLGGRDSFPCGFAWVKVINVRLNTKLGKAMASCGFSKSYAGGIDLWNPARSYHQSVMILEAGARAYAKVLSDHGFKAYVETRLD